MRALISAPFLLFPEDREGRLMGRMVPAGMEIEASGELRACGAGLFAACAPETRRAAMRTEESTTFFRPSKHSMQVRGPRLRAGGRARI